MHLQSANNIYLNLIPVGWVFVSVVSWGWTGSCLGWAGAWVGTSGAGSCFGWLIGIAVGNGANAGLITFSGGVIALPTLKYCPPKSNKFIADIESWAAWADRYSIKP